MARKFSCLFVDRINLFDRPPSELTFAPMRWRSKRLGGPDTAQISVSGPEDALPDVFRLLGDRIKIYNEYGSAVFWGHVHEVDMSYGGVTTTLSLEGMANAIAVVYTERRADGSSERKTTDWATDIDSIIRFGRKEDRPSFEGTTEAAQEFRDQELARRAWPVPVERHDQKPVGAVIYAQGPIHRLNWQYYENLAGLEEYNADGPGEQYIGASYTATTIAFISADDITDSANGLSELRVGDKIVISGAGVNNGEFTVGDVAVGAIEVVENILTIAAAGPSVTISVGPRIDRIAQSFALSTNVDSWTVSSISIRVMRVGNPTSTIDMDLCADSGGSPGTVLETVKLTGSTLSDDMAWTEFPFSNTIALVYGATYHIVVRHPARSLLGYYIVDVNEDATYAGGQVQVYNGSTWAVRDPAADMAFRITGKVGTLGQVRTIIESNDDFSSGSVTVVHQSNVPTWQWRDGDSRGMVEVEELIDIGCADGTALQLDVLESRRVIIYREPGTDMVEYARERGGLTRHNTGLPIEPGMTIAGVWVNVVDTLPKLDIFKPARALFVAESEYDALADLLTYETEGALSVWQGRRIQSG